MIAWSEKTITRIVCYGVDINVVNMSEKEVWSAIRSCFGAGYWNNTYGWSNTDGWKNE